MTPTHKLPNIHAQFLSGNKHSEGSYDRKHPLDNKVLTEKNIKKDDIERLTRIVTRIFDKIIKSGEYPEDLDKFLSQQQCFLVEKFSVETVKNVVKSLVMERLVDLYVELGRKAKDEDLPKELRAMANAFGGLSELHKAVIHSKELSARLLDLLEAKRLVLHSEMLTHRANHERKMEIETIEKIKIVAKGRYYLEIEILHEEPLDDRDVHVLRLMRDEMRRGDQFRKGDRRKK